MELPLDIHIQIWDSVRRLVYKDRYNRVIRELERFVKDQRSDKYYISKLDPYNQSMFMYLNFTHEFSFLAAVEDISPTMFKYEMDCLEIWVPYLENYERIPLQNPTLYRKLKRIYNIWYYRWFIYYYYNYNIDLLIDVIYEYFNIRDT